MRVSNAVEERSRLFAAALDGGLQALDIGFVLGQIPLVGSEGGEGVSQQLGFAVAVIPLVVDPGPFPAVDHQVGLGEDLEVAGDAALSHIEDADDLVDIQWPPAEKPHEAQPGLVCQGLVDFELFGHATAWGLGNGLVAGYRLE